MRSPQGKGHPQGLQHQYDWQSEPYHQNQNPGEWRYRTIKAWANTIMNRTGAPAYCWLLTLQYVILNLISTASLGGQVPFRSCMV